ncbi:MAG: transcriptional repressor [Alphaproteobacteria bacterium]|nr:transcriptional repressor [Alphaproteobacteria bacterium]
MIKTQKHAALELTEKQNLVMETLAKSKRPLGAYSILDALRDDGFKAPLQVYRTLDQLITLGMVHRLESLNAYTVCQLDSCASRNSQSASFVICEMCGLVEELAHSNVEGIVSRLLTNFDFRPTKTAIEIRGVCASCQS